MTRIAWIGVLAAGVLSSGCLPNSFLVPDKTPAKPIESARPIERPPVVAGQINDANAKEKAQALREELDLDMERAPDAEAAKLEKK